MRLLEGGLGSDMDELNSFIHPCLDSRETKRALAAWLILQRFTY